MATERTVALIEHLSAEIQGQVSAMVTWRAKMNFTAYFGPWFVFAGYFAVKETRPVWPTQDDDLKACLAGLAVLYLSFGYGCAFVERHVWEQCNRWRAVIARLHSAETPSVGESDLRFGQRLRLSYLGVYLLMLATFVLGACALTMLTPEPAKPKSPPAMSAPSDPTSPQPTVR